MCVCVCVCVCACVCVCVCVCVLVGRIINLDRPGHFNPDALAVRIVFKYEPHKGFIERINKHRVNISAVQVLITSDQCCCLLLKCKVNTGRQESRPRIEKFPHHNIQMHYGISLVCKQRCSQTGPGTFPV